MYGDCNQPATQANFPANLQLNRKMSRTTIQGVGNREGNRRFVVAPVMRHRLFLTLLTLKNLKAFLRHKFLDVKMVRVKTRSQFSTRTHETS